MFGTLICWVPFCILNTRLYFIQSFQPCSFSVTQVPPLPTKIREWQSRLYNSRHFMKWTRNGSAVHCNCNCILLRSINTHKKCYRIRNIHKNFKSIFKKYQLVNCAVILNTVCAVSHLMSLLCMDRIIVVVKLQHD